jgi:hypothetical protein
MTTHTSLPAELATAHATEIVAAACAHLHVTPNDVRLVPESSFAHPELPNTFGFMVIGRDVFLGLRATEKDGQLIDWKVMEMD